MSELNNTETINQEQGLKKVLGPMHIWALGVGIVLVGEFMGWNLAVQKGGSLGAIIACWVMALMYISLVMMNLEIGSVLPEAGGQYAMAKYLLGPLAAFNVGLMIVFEYVMLEAADIVVVGALLQNINPHIQSLPYVVLTIMILTYINYRGAHGALTINFVLTAIAFITVIILVVSSNFYSPSNSLINLSGLTNGLPYGLIGILGALQFGCWFFLGIEGTVLATEECRSVGRALPIGTIAGMVTLLIGGTAAWFVCSGLVEAGILSGSLYPLYDAACMIGKPFVVIALLVGTLLACIASANGCINDGSRALYAMGRDTLLPGFFAVLHPKYKTPYRAILFLLPIAMAFGFAGILDQTVTFSILSALLTYILTAVMMIKFRRMYPKDSLHRGYIAPLYPLPVIIVLVLAFAALVGMYFSFWIPMVAGIAFYLIASLWFTIHRYESIDNKKFIELGAVNWPVPKGYSDK